METPVTGQSKRQKSYEFYKKLLKLIIGGSAEFWAITIAFSLLPIAAEFRAALSISYVQVVIYDTLLAGIIISGCFSFFLLRFFEKIPTKHPIPKALILCIVALFIIEVLSTIGDPGNAYVYLIIDTVMNIPRILALGVVIGYLYKRLHESEWTVPLSVDS